MVPRLTRPSSSARASSSSGSANRLGTGWLSPSLWVEAWVEEKPAAPAAMASARSRPISTTSDGVAARAEPSGPMTHRRRLQWPT